MSALQPGDQIGDRYVVDRLIGEGGIARVYRVTHRHLGSTHALKILAMPVTMLADRMLQEGRIQAQLRHPHLVAVTDVVEHAGQIGLVMEYVAGPTLRNRIETTGAMPLDEALGLFSQVLSGVAAAHAVGVLHRDLKPENILLQETTGGVQAKVSDFGIAKAAGAGLRDGTTRMGVQLGTPGYMAPEQIAETDAVDQRSDIFALGTILYEMLSGRRALAHASTFESLAIVAEGRIPPLDSQVPGLPANVVDAVNTALSFSPADRFATCEAMAAALLADHPDLVASFLHNTLPGGRGSLFTPLSQEALSTPDSRSHTMVPDFDLQVSSATSVPTPPDHTGAGPSADREPRRSPLRWRAAAVAIVALIVAAAWGWSMRSADTAPERLVEPAPHSDNASPDSDLGTAGRPQATAEARPSEPDPVDAAPIPAVERSAVPSLEASTVSSPSPGPESRPSRESSTTARAAASPSAASPSATSSSAASPPLANDLEAAVTPALAESTPPPAVTVVHIQPEPEQQPEGEGEGEGDAGTVDLVGTWKGEAGGNPLVIRIAAQKGSAVAGTVLIRLGATDRTAAVRGTFDPATSALVLEEKGGMRLYFSGTLTGTTLSGTFTRQGSRSGSPWTASLR